MSAAIAGVPFKPGVDPRREAARRSPRTGRPVGAKTLGKLIRGRLGRDAEAIVDQVAVLAKAGDPQALLAAAVLIGAAIDSGQT